MSKASGSQQPVSEGPPSGWLPAGFQPGLVSVIIPTYNCAHLVGETLGSVLAQTHDQVEAIVADDGSTDNIAEAVAPWQERFRREKGWDLRLLRLEHTGGPSEGRNAGALASRGEFLNYLDGDDLLGPDKIAEQFAVMRATGADFVYGPCVRFYQQPGGYRLGVVKNLAPIAGASHLEALLENRSWRLMAALLTRQFSNRVGPSDPEMVRCEDADYVLRCSVAAERAVHCPRGVLYYRAQANTMSSRRSERAHRSLAKLCLAMEARALELLPPELAKARLAQVGAQWAVIFFEEGAPEHGRFWAERVLVHDPAFRPRGVPALSSLAYRLGGFRLWAMESRLRKTALGLAGRAWSFLRPPPLVPALPLATGDLLRVARVR